MNKLNQNKTRWWGCVATLVALFAGGVLALPTQASVATAAKTDTVQSRPMNEPDALVIRKIVAGKDNFCFLTQAGSVYCWGSFNSYTFGNYGGQPALVKGAASGITDLTLGEEHACVLTSSGAVKCWGGNATGQLGNAQTDYAGSKTLTDVVGLSSGVIAIAAGGNTSCAVKAGGVPYCWGKNDHGQLGIGSTQAMSVPVMVTGALSNVVSLATGGHTCSVTTSGGAWCWGDNGYGQLGDGTTVAKNAPVPVSGLSSGVLTIDTSENTTCALMTGGGVKCWGSNLYPIGSNNTPTDMVGLTSGVAQLSLGDSHACAQLTDGSVKCWGDDAYGDLGDGLLFKSTNTPVSVIGVSNATYVAVSDRWSSCAVIGGNAIKCWGDNRNGGLGNGEITYRASPFEVPGLTGVIGLGLGRNHSCAVVNPGIVKCWGGGYNASDTPLGNNGGEYLLTPTTVYLGAPSVLLEGVNQISTADDTNCAIRVNAITCWGFSPPNVSALPAMPTQISVARSHACVLIGGGVKCSGHNFRGGLGDGTTVDNNAWVDAIGLTSGVAKITTGNYHTCALLVGGGVKCWGWNLFGQVGDGTKIDRSTPTDVMGLSSGVADIGVGGNHACAAMSDGSVKCWGLNSSGQLGDEQLNNQTTPVVVAGLSGISKLAAGEEHTCALTSAGGVKCWGDNFTGSLGNGSVGLIGNHKSGPPGDVVGLTTGVATVVVSRGGGHSCAIMTNGTARCWGDDFWGQVGDQHLGFVLTPTNVLLNGVGNGGGDVTPTDSNGNTTFSFAGGTFTASVILSYSVPSTIPPLGNLRGVNRVFDVTPLFADTGLPATPTGRYTTTVTYAEADLGGAAEGSLGLYYWDGSKWVLEPSSSVNAAANTVSASPNHFSTWAVLSGAQASNKKYVYLPMIVK